MNPMAFAQLLQQVTQALEALAAVNNLLEQFADRLDSLENAVVGVQAQTSNDKADAAASGVTQAQGAAGFPGSIALNVATAALAAAPAPAPEAPPVIPGMDPYAAAQHAAMLAAASNSAAGAVQAASQQGAAAPVAPIGG